MIHCVSTFVFFFFFNDTATTEIYTLSLHDALPIYAGAFSRLLALAIDGGVVYGSLLLVTAAIAFLISVFSNAQAGTVVLALGFVAWSLIAITYLVVFWSGAGRTPGMS